MSNILTQSVPNAALINTIAQSLGMSDFYQVGLWNHCQGNFGEGITECVRPRAFYWFDPMLFARELLGGADSKYAFFPFSFLFNHFVESHTLFCIL